ncbi:glycosyltransferase family 2 protein [Flavobacterium sp. JLP]|uniref:glycosyltransferase family 2 protein n=1 Tax=unclassified Flavobacterium TaxID=196869 RepID=UPI0004931DE1|nr:MULTISPECIES: glycosyltransferase family A protein [unclassified Flavobacterium]MBF4507118.1 glycosyltransferase family 2 protein [Flavobacterium sp. JLP]
MIVLYHNLQKVIRVISKNNEALPFDKNANIAAVFVDLGIQHPESKIVWCHENYRDFINLDVIENIFHHNKMMLSYNPNSISFLGKKIGYVDQSPFIKINKEVRYPTWQMSSFVGVVHSAVLLAVHKKIKLDSDFDYFLNSVAKVGMPLGLLCYSENKLLREDVEFNIVPKSSNFTLFKFVKQHYKTQWIFLLFFNLAINEFKFPFFALLYSFFFKNRNNADIKINDINNFTSVQKTDSETIDVIIPTIGRKKFLYDFLKDLSKQTIVPNNVIVIEQNPLFGSVSELDYLISEPWPFKIKHTFTNQAGACNARNLALKDIESEWLFFADDDIRITESFIESAFNQITINNSKVLTFSCLQKGQINTHKEIFQWIAFGSGCSIVKSEVVTDLFFDLRYEFGFGEDGDFGMQIRNKGYDILFFPNPQILHLKAPIGGFRTKPEVAWTNDKIKPKPSPTILLYKILHETKEQLKGYKTMLFIKYYSKQSIKNPIKYFLNFQKEWKQSLYWANKLINKE